MDANMNVVEKEAMKAGPRYGMTSTTVIDKFIFAIGGSSQKSKPTDTVEVFDTSKNVWYPVGSLNKARSSTSCCTINHRQIFVFPGQ